MKAKTDEILNISEKELEEVSAGLPAFDPENPSEYLAHCPQDDNGNRIVPDDIFNSFCKYLPDGTYNESKTYRAYNGGKLFQIGSDPDKTKEVTTAGGQSLQATQKQRRTFAESFEIILRQKARPETIAELQLADNATNQDAIVAAAVIQALTGNMKAQQFVRDTVGEMPTVKQEITADILTAEDRELLEKIRSRQQADKRKTDQKRPEETETE